MSGRQGCAYVSLGMRPSLLPAHCGSDLRTAAELGKRVGAPMQVPSQPACRGGNPTPLPPCCLPLSCSLVAGGPYTEDMQPSIVPLLPELALLPALEELRVEVTGHRIGVAKGLDLQDWQVSRVAGIPPEWGHPGAFPRLQV